ncbi:hypothetical protein GCM10010259_22750 [Streptomyces daghestanicus]|uniref:Uncharacterized protein n=1 Tax=Streptomyces daghestanicus TaxID=66885 RepID=A0ABQ3Q6H5_9ACTN|nr:hypothetical protein GCM10010240_31590 [Streptomyces griseoviridis]GGU31728.1 hypothetical protein GCM10010259_22750 [Streptomyces daghestanicus]GHI32860.1 hypothetical protein Sdagh_45900 [Streptomyces daghestanicus]
MRPGRAGFHTPAPRSWGRPLPRWTAVAQADPGRGRGPHGTAAGRRAGQAAGVGGRAAQRGTAGKRAARRWRRLRDDAPRAARDRGVSADVLAAPLGPSRSRMRKPVRRPETGQDGAEPAP